MRICVSLLVAIAFWVAGCASNPAGGLSRETATEVALQALKQQGFPIHREYKLSAKKQSGVWELRFEFEPRIPGNAMLVRVDKHGQTRVLPANYER